MRKFMHAVAVTLAGASLAPLPVSAAIDFAAIEVTSQAPATLKFAPKVSLKPATSKPAPNNATKYLDKNCNLAFDASSMVPLFYFQKDPTIMMKRIVDNILSEALEIRPECMASNRKTINARFGQKTDNIGYYRSRGGEFSGKLYMRRLDRLIDGPTR